MAGLSVRSVVLRSLLALLLFPVVMGGFTGVTDVARYKGTTAWPGPAVPAAEVIVSGLTVVAMDIWSFGHEVDGRGYTPPQYVPTPLDLRPSHTHTLLIHPQGMAQARNLRGREGDASGEDDDTEEDVRGCGWSHALGQGEVCASL